MMSTIEIPSNILLDRETSLMFFFAMCLAIRALPTIDSVPLILGTIIRARWRALLLTIVAVGTLIRTVTTAATKDAIPLP